MSGETKHTPEKGKQVRAQYLAVAHLATALAMVHTEIAPTVDIEGAESLLDIRGQRSAHIMEVLGDILNGMDAVDAEKDAWLRRVFEKAHEMFPATDETPTLLAQRDELLRALEGLLTYDRVMRPALRAKPVGAPNSTARLDQDKLIALEDAALLAVEKARTR